MALVRAPWIEVDEGVLEATADAMLPEIPNDTDEALWLLDWLAQGDEDAPVLSTCPCIPVQEELEAAAGDAVLVRPCQPACTPDFIFLLIRSQLRVHVHEMLTHAPLQDSLHRQSSTCS